MDMFVAAPHVASSALKVYCRLFCDGGYPAQNSLKFKLILKQDANLWAHVHEGGISQISMSILLVCGVDRGDMGICMKGKKGCNCLVSLGIGLGTESRSKRSTLG